MKLGKKIVVVFILSSILFLVFNFKWSNSDLGDNYFLLDRYESIDIGYPGGEAIIYKSTQEYVYDSVVLTGFNFTVNYNEDYIIVKESFENISQHLKYYIIKKTDSIFGPYSFQVLKQKKEEMNIEFDFN